MGKTMELLRWKQHSKTAQADEEPESNRIYLSEILSALSFALDLTEAAVPGHSVRSCLIGMRIAKKLRLSHADMQSLYYGLLLKDIGCSSNAARMCEIIGGDDRAVKSGVKLTDWRGLDLSSFRLLWENVLPNGTSLERLMRIAKIGIAQKRTSEEIIGVRCDRGASIVIKLGLGDDAAEAVRCLDEHWDGGGFPRRLRGERIPILARILAVSQHLDVFANQHNPEEAISVLKERSGRWFDPELASPPRSTARTPSGSIAFPETIRKPLAPPSSRPIQPISSSSQPTRSTTSAPPSPTSSTPRARSPSATPWA